MTELQTQIMYRADEAIASLLTAEAEEDHHLTVVRLGELESLARTAVEHGLDLPVLRAYAPQGA